MMEVKYPRRILVVGAPNSSALKTIEALTGTAPQPHATGSTAGLTHEWHVKTAYYEARISIWVDEIADVEAWKTEFLKPEAKEVIEAVGAWIYCFNMKDAGHTDPEVEKIMKAIQEISEEHAGYEADTVMLAIASPERKQIGNAIHQHREEWEDTCQQYGFEFVDDSAEGKNEFGENTGLARLKEALEANEWAGAAGSDDDELDLEGLGLADGDEDDFHGFARDEAEMTAELFGMKAALTGDDFEPEADDFIPPSQQETQVEDLDRLMGKLLAVKEQSADLPEAQRKRMAARAVRELLDESAKP